MRRLGLRKTPFGLRPLRYFAPPHFASPGLAAQALIRAGKTSSILNVMQNCPLTFLGNDIKCIVIMYEIVIFIDSENIPRIDDSYLTLKTKIFIMVGINQEKISFDLLKDKYSKVGAIELIKVNGSGNNALDFFISFYLGKFYNDLKNSKIVIYSKDGGYEPLMNHLLEKNVNIVRIKKEIAKESKIEKTKKIDNINSIEKKYNEVRQHFHPVNKHPRPRSLRTLRIYFDKALKKNNYSKDEIETIIKLLIENNIIKITDTKKDSIKWLI